MSKVAVKVRSDDTWMERGACIREDPERFFPLHSDDPAIKSVKQICGSCEVSSECLAYALTHRQDHGVWGGKTPDERDLLLYGRRRPHRNW